MKKQILLILCSILALNAGAERISRDEALALAQDFMQGKVMVPVQASSSKAPLRGSVNDESFYIFNAVDNGGYAIIAADDRVSPVLGFSNQGNIDLDNMPENMASWLEYYEYEINSLKNNADIVLDMPISRNEVKPLLNNSWDQEAPHNLLCPVYDGIQCPVGCVALAMAQIMYYHKWPTGVIDSIPPYANSSHNYELVEGLPATMFKWNLIKPSYSIDETDESSYAVAELLRYCGQAVEMGYETDGSGAYTEDVPKALIERFNYSKQTRQVNKWDYSSYDWDELIYNELTSGRPVYYAGYRALESSGHAFVCDGYKDGYFHIQWGTFRCYYDGYFKLSLLSMEEPGLNNQYNYGYYQRAIIGIEPEMNSLIGTTFTDEKVKYTLLSDTSAMIQAIDGKDYYGIDTLWIPDHVDYNGNRYYVTRIGKSENLKYNFKKVYLPSSLKQIDTEASFLQTINEFTIPFDVEELSSTAFKNNRSLVRFNAEEGYSHYKIIDGVLFSPDGKELMCYPQSRKDTCYTVPDGVEIIGGYSFYKSYLSGITIHDGVEHINDYAFYECTNLKKINLPDNLKDIGNCAFQKCYELSDVTLPQKIGNISIQAFNTCKSLKSIIIPNSLNYCLAAEIFQNCSLLESVYIPSGIKLIRSNCFTGCSALKEITVESIVPPLFETYSVFDEAVYENAVLKVPAGKVELYRNSAIWSRFKNISAIPSYTINGINYDLSESAKIAVVIPGKKPYSGDIVIPASVEHNGIEYTVNAMQPAAFAGCQDLTSVEIDASIDYLTDSLFKDCSSLKSVKLNDGIVKIGHYVFYGCSALEAIDIPQGVASIGESLFRECKSLRSITFPESVRLLGPYAFYGCTDLDSVTFCGFMHQLDALVFKGCSNLTYVSLPKNLTRILDNAFYECSNLQTITIPENVTAIFKGAFYNCTSLTTIDLPEDLTSIGSYAFFGCQSLESITIPENVTTIEKYTFWDCTSLTYIVLPKSLNSISSYAFYGCQSLESITIPENVTIIDDHAFMNCQSLKSITLPDGITFIGNNAFARCSNLDSIVIPQGMKKIERSAFDLCINLKSVILPESITELDSYAFIECYSLTTITIPANVRKIGKMAFEDCRSMASFYCCVENPQEIELGENVFNRINENCILYVPQGCAQAYRDDERWNAFSEIREFGVTQVEPVSRQAAVPVEYYNLSGGKQPGLQNGINIIRYNDGTVRKVIQ